MYDGRNPINERTKKKRRSTTKANQIPYANTRPELEPSLLLYTPRRSFHPSIVIFTNSIKST